MKAKNPNGGEDVEVHFPAGPEYQQWAKVCKGCGAGAGGCFSGPGLPPPQISPYAICPCCDGHDLELVPVGEEPDESPPPVA